MTKRLSGTQLLYLGLQKETRANYAIDETTLPPGPAVCRICGGPLLAGYKSASERSDNWTDENLCQRRDSNHICMACGWFTEGKNRTRFWSGNAAVHATETSFDSVSINGLLKKLSKPFPLPSVFILRGGDPNIPRKHQQWRTIEGVTESRQQTKVSFVGLQAFKLAKLSGIAVFDADQMVEMVHRLTQLGNTYLLPRTEQMKSDWQKRNFIYHQLMEATKEAGTPTALLAAYFAAHQLIPPLERGTGSDNE